MTDLYWIMVLGNLRGLIDALLIVHSVIFLVSIILYLIQVDIEGSSVKRAIKVLKSMIYTLIVTIIFSVILPTQQQLYAIYGVGGAIDYLKENKEAEKLPDNIIKAANAFLEKYQEDNKN